MEISPVLVDNAEGGAGWPEGRDGVVVGIKGATHCGDETIGGGGAVFPPAIPIPIPK
jgi:hypothetical protein